MKWTKSVYSWEAQYNDKIKYATEDEPKNFKSIEYEENYYTSDERLAWIGRKYRSSVLPWCSQN